MVVLLLEGAHLRKRSCAVMSRPQAVTCKRSIMCTSHSCGSVTPYLFDLGQEQFDNHLSVSQRWLPPGNLSSATAKYNVTSAPFSSPLLPNTAVKCCQQPFFFFFFFASADQICNGNQDKEPLIVRSKFPFAYVHHCPWPESV